jgi:hypothetical protein
VRSAPKCMLCREVRFALDSLLERDGFELLVPRTAARELGIFQRTQVDHLWHSDRLPRWASSRLRRPDFLSMASASVHVSAGFVGLRSLGPALITHAGLRLRSRSPRNLSAEIR